MRAIGLLTLAAAAGCAQLGVVGDGSSVSFGPPNQGALLDGSRLAVAGEGYEVPERWRLRGSQWGTDELVGVIRYAGQRVAAQLPGDRFQVADLSVGGGGSSPYHKSHQTGRDADLLFFVRDAAGKPARMEIMRRFGDDGASIDEGEPLVFDAPRTWVLVRALLEAPGPGVKHLFIYAPLRDQLLDHARAIGEPEELVAWAAEVLAQPGDSAPHDDHLHLRVYCAETDPLCEDYGRINAAKKPPARRERALAKVFDAHPVVGASWFRTIRW